MCQFLAFQILQQCSDGAVRLGVAGTDQISTGGFLQSGSWCAALEGTVCEATVACRELLNVQTILNCTLCVALTIGYHGNSESQDADTMLLFFVFTYGRSGDTFLGIW